MNAIVTAQDGSGATPRREVPARVLAVAVDGAASSGLAARLARLGHAPCGAISCAQATAAEIGRLRPDVILLDPGAMPEPDAARFAAGIETGTGATVATVAATFTDRELTATLGAALARFRFERLSHDLEARIAAEVGARTAQIRADLDRFAAFARVGAEWLWETDAEDRFTYFSPVSTVSQERAQARLGMTRREGAAQDADNLALVAEVEALVRRRAPFRDMRYRTGLPGERQHWCSITAEPRFDDAGRFLGYRGAGRDVTELVEAQAELTRRARLFEAMLRAMPDGVTVVDPHYQGVFANDNLFELFGIDRAAARASPDPVQFAMLEMARRGEYGEGDPAELVARRKDAYRDILAAHGAHRDERRTASGRWIETRSQQIDGGGWFSLYRDMTEARANALEAERQSDLLRSIVASLRDGISVFDKGLRLVAWNDRFLELAGVDPSLAKVGTPLRDILVHQAGGGAFGPCPDPEAEADRRIATLWRNQPFVAERARPDGRSLEVRRSPLPDGGYVTIYVDVTERRRHEQELERQSVLLRTIFANMGEGISIFDPDRRLQAWNDRFLELTGVTPELARVGTPLREIVLRQAADGEFGPCDPGAETDRRIGTLWGEQRFVVERTRPNGRSFELRRSPLPDGGYVTLYVDTTARNKAEMALREINATLERRIEERTAALAKSERFSRATIDALGAHVAVLDHDGVIVAANEAWERFARLNGAAPGATSEGTNYLAACERALGPGSEGAHAIAGAIRDVIDGRRLRFEVEYPCHSPRELRWFLCRITRFAAGNETRVVVAHEEVTAVHLALERLEQQQQAFAVLAEVSPVGIFRNDPDGSCVDVNRRWCEMSGMSAEDALGDGWLAALHPDDRERVRREWAAASLAMPFRSEYRLKHRDGHVTWVIGEAREVLGADGARAGFIGAVIDITERKQTELALQALTSDLAFLEGDEFFEAAAHKIAEIANSDYAFIAECSAARPDEAQLRAVIEDGNARTVGSYSLAGTPCQEVLLGNEGMYPSGVARQFPDDAFLSAHAIEGYAAAPLLDSAGHALGHVGVMCRTPFSNPERMRRVLSLFRASVAAELVRQRGERRFTDLIELAPDAIVMCDGSGRIEMANRLAGRIFAWPRDELVGKPIELLLPEAARPAHSGHRARFAAEGRARTMAADRPDLQALRKDGSTFPVEVSLAPIDGSDGRSVVAIVRDITARKKAEDELAALRANLVDAVESISQAVVLYDRDDRIVLFNRRFVDLYPELHDIIRVGLPFAELVGTAAQRAALGDPADVEAFLADRLARHRRADGVPIIRHLPTGRVLSIVEQRSQSGGIISVVTDITDQLEQEAKLREAQKMEALGKLTGGLAHDFNNYIGSIIGNLELVRERISRDEAAIRQIDNALGVATRAADLTRSLLAFARRQPLAPKTIDTGACVGEVVRLIAGTLGEDVTVRLDADPGIWPVCVDEAQLSSSLVNLANNARDAMPKGGALTIALRNATLAPGAAAAAGIAAGDYVRIDFTDTGTGMSDEVLASAFQPFFTTKGPGHGTGLGLSMVYGFVKQSGGHVAIRSSRDAGTTVTIHLPRALASGEAAAAPSGPAPRGHECVLVVEDNETMREAVVQQLADLGYRVVEADSGDAAIGLLERDEPRIDLLFTDLVMPGRLDGHALARLALARRPGLKVLLTSGFPGNTLGADGQDAGDLRLLPKPYRKADLARAVRAALDS